MDNTNSLPVRLLGPFAHYPIFENMCRHLDAIDIIRLTRTCRDMSDIYRRLLQTRWNIDQRLKRFVKDPIGFRRRLRLLEALISGGFALQFFDRTLWKESDLDVYLKAGDDDINDFIDYLVDHEGYTVAMRYIEDGSYNGDKSFEGIGAIIDLVREDRRKIQLLRCRMTPIKVILGGFYTTAVLNVITWDAAYCLFPHVTFTERQLRMLQEFASRHEPLVQKYIRRGWTFHRRIRYGQPVLKKAIFFDTGFGKEKLIGDASTWKITFDKDSMSPTPPPHHDLERTHISLEENMDSDYDFFTISRVAPFISLGLEREYLYGHPQWARWLARKLLPRIRQNLARLDADSRPPFYEDLMFQDDRNMARYTQEWTPPRLLPWHYYDEKIPEWFEDYEAGTQLP